MSCLPGTFPNSSYHIQLTEGEDETKEGELAHFSESLLPFISQSAFCSLPEWLNQKFDRRDLVAVAVCAAISLWYALQKVRIYLLHKIKFTLPSKLN